LSYELVISSTPGGDRIALLQDKRLLELHQEEPNVQLKVGDVYMGVVRKIDTSMNAAFVDVGHEKDGFLHYLDLGANVANLIKYTKMVQNGTWTSSRLDDFEMEPPIEKLGKLTEVLQKGQNILVQVTKEAISTKGPRLNCELSLAGRFLILVPFSESINISKRIVAKDERQRLTKIVRSLKLAHFGCIIRTAAEGIETEELERDLHNLIQKWDEGFQKLKDAKPRDAVMGEMSRRSSVLRDLLSDDFESITCDTKETYDEVRSYVSAIAPEKERIVKLHNSKIKLFEAAGVERQIKSLFGKTVTMPGGGYIIVEHTEAMHSIDVNSGSSSNKRNSEDQESYNLTINSEACREVARQLRLRDIGGIIIIDFIDQRKAENKKMLFDMMRLEMKGDKAKSTILPLTKFGLMQITRERVRPQTNIATAEVCPTCNGTGTIAASIVITDVIEDQLDFLLTKQNEKSLTLIAHPFITAYFREGFYTRQMKWFMKYKTWIKVEKDSSLPLTEFRFLNKNQEVIVLDMK